MKHPSNREFFAYWDQKRGDGRAPDRTDIEPGAVRGLLGDIFVLSYDASAGYPFRVAGTRVCALLGADLKDKSFSGLFEPGSRRDIEEIIAAVAEETLAAVAGVTAATSGGPQARRGFAAGSKLAFLDAPSRSRGSKRGALVAAREGER